MDPITITAAVVVPFLVNYAKHLAGVAADVVDESVADGLRGVWKAVRDRFRRDAQADGALERLAEKPDDPRRQAAVEDHLEEALRDDADFASSLAKLLRAAGTTTISDVRVSNSGAVAVGGDITISAGGHAGGRDVIVGDIARDDPRV